MEPRVGARLRQRGVERGRVAAKASRASALIAAEASTRRSASATARAATPVENALLLRTASISPEAGSKPSKRVRAILRWRRGRPVPVSRAGGRRAEGLVEDGHEPDRHLGTDAGVAGCQPVDEAEQGRPDHLRRCGRPDSDVVIVEQAPVEPDLVGRTHREALLHAYARGEPVDGVATLLRRARRRARASAIRSRAPSSSFTRSPCRATRTTASIVREQPSTMMVMGVLYCEAASAPSRSRCGARS